jgi:sigma-B regulation protein RsbU (phosphoserine phosphatase)
LVFEPERLLKKLNQQLTVDLKRLDAFITAQVVYLNSEKHEFIFSNAGHCPILLQEKSGKMRRLGMGEPPLGVSERSLYSSKRYRIRSGEKLFFLTDGLYEVEGKNKKTLGIDGITRVIPQLWRKGSTPFCSNLFSFIKNYSGKVPADDDRTLLVVERL